MRMKKARRKPTMARILAIAAAAAILGTSVAAAPDGDDTRCSEVSEPINPSSKNPFTIIRNIIFPDEEFEFAILATSHAGHVYNGVVVIRVGDHFRCEDRHLDVTAAITPAGSLDRAKLAGLKVNARGKEVAPEIATALGGLLKDKVLRAAYTPPNAQVMLCDGSNYEVYWRHMAAEVFPSSGYEFTHPGVIETALAQLVASDDPRDHIRWNQIKEYLEAKRAGRNPSPFVPQSLPATQDVSDLPPP